MGDVYMVNGKILSGLPNHAKDIIFDNSETTLSSTNTEDAIKEVNSKLVEHIKCSSASDVIVSVGNLYAGGTPSYTYTATKDCWVFMRMVSFGGASMTFTINGLSNFNEIYASTTVPNELVSAPIAFPLKQGDVLQVNAPQTSYSGLLLILG